MIISPKGLGPENDYTGESQQYFQKRPVLSSERAPEKNKTVSVKDMGLDTKTY
jgi:hypothetical protein